MYLVILMAVGQIEDKFRRTYVCVNPDAALGPPTWRLAVPQEVGDGGETGGGGGNGKQYGFQGESPINVTTEPSLSPGKDNVTTSLDIKELTDRAE